MPTGRLTMRRIRDVLRLRFAQGLSERTIAASLGLGKGSVGTYLRRARDAGLAWPLPEGLDDDSLELLLFPNASDVSDPDRPVPDWAAVDKELRRRSVTRMLLWQEYRAQHPNGFGYTWFCTHFEAWKGRVRPSMRQRHVGGEKVFIDFAGDTIDIVDPATGEVSEAKLFVAASRPKACNQNIGAPSARRGPRAIPMLWPSPAKGWRTGLRLMSECSPIWAACRRSSCPTISSQP